MDIVHLFNQVFCEHCGFTVAVPVYCKNRFCPTCSHHRNRLIRHKLTTFLESIHLRKYDSFKFLTLTIRNNPDLKCMTDELITSFRKLRQRAFWKKHVRGGACVIEAKPGKDGWHVHLHIVIESAFIPYQALLSEWTAVSTGTGVYIKKLHGSQVVGYLTKYLTKQECTQAEQKNMTDILKGRRLFVPFGSWFDPIRKIPPIKFRCPGCDCCNWFYGNPTVWFNGLTPEYVNYKLIDDTLKPIARHKQRILALTGNNMIVNVD